MKLLKSLGLVALGIAASKLFPEQVDQLIDYAASINAETIKAGITYLKDFVISIIDIFTGSEAAA